MTRVWFLCCVVSHIDVDCCAGGPHRALIFSTTCPSRGGYAVPCPCRRIPSLDFNWRHISYSRLADVQHFVERGWLVSPVHPIITRLLVCVCCIVRFLGPYNSTGSLCTSSNLFLYFYRYYYSSQRSRFYS